MWLFSYLDRETSLDEPNFICLLANDISWSSCLSCPPSTPPSLLAQRTLHYQSLFSGLSLQLAVKPQGQDSFISVPCPPPQRAQHWAYCGLWETMRFCGNLGSGPFTHSFIHSSHSYFLNISYTLETVKSSHRSLGHLRITEEGWWE